MTNHKLYLSDKDLSERYAVTRITVWRWAREGTLPKPIKLSVNTTRWRLSDLESFEATREGKQ
jgi:prophage regulatory protein